MIAAADPAVGNPNRCGTPQLYVPAPLVPQLFAAPANGQRIIYLNKTGGHFTVGNTTDSTTNAVSTNILQASVSQFDIAPIPKAFNWPVIRDCLEKDFAPFNVRLTEERPKTGPYVMAVIGGTGAEIGFDAQSGILGITSTDSFCNVWETGITLNFAPNHLPIQDHDLELCATIAHEAGHALSLEHEQLDKDLMSYVPVASSPSKAFVNQISGCGVDTQDPNPCSCPMVGSGTNSGQRLLQNVGARPTDGTAPTLDVKQPADGAKVAPSFKVIASASDASGMADVLVIIDGVEAGADEVGSNGTWTAIATTTEGTHTVTVRARDLAGNVTDKTLNITAAKLELGDSCTGNDACKSALCAMESDGTSFCTQTCTPGTAGTCPADFDCDATAKVCTPATGGGCCSTGTSGTGAMFLGIVVGGALLRRRRRS